MDDLFNSREIAYGIWLAIVLAIFICWKVSRLAIIDFLKYALVPQVLIPLILSFIPTALVVAVLAYLGFWDLSILKETIYWAVGTGLVMFGLFAEIKSAKDLYKRTAKEALKITILLEFFIGFYVFPLWIELLLLPLITAVLILSAFVEALKRKEDELTAKFLNGMTVVVGLIIILAAMISFINNPKPLFTFQNLELFLLPIVLSFTYTVSVYFVALYSKYELAFSRINHFLSLSNIDKRPIKLAAIRRCGLSVHAADEIVRHLSMNFNNETTKAQALDIVRTFDTDK